jgi:hypothetical protein
MAKGTIRHLFPGGNTSLGFFSYYDYILPQEEAAHIFILKGGPGTGKSTFMKKIAYEMTDRGYNVEFMHCSSDPNSLDGVVIPAARIAFIDGTSPHVVDPKNPGAVDEIIHLGDFWDENGVKENRSGITNDNKEIGRYFARAYRYIKAAASVYEDITVINSLAADGAAVNAKAILSFIQTSFPVADYIILHSVNVNIIILFKNYFVNAYAKRTEIEFLLFICLYP